MRNLNYEKMFEMFLNSVDENKKKFQEDNSVSEQDTRTPPTNIGRSFIIPDYWDIRSLHCPFITSSCKTLVNHCKTSLPDEVYDESTMRGPKNT